jgi:hypothetical protein
MNENKNISIGKLPVFLLLQELHIPYFSHMKKETKPPRIQLDLTQDYLELLQLMAVRGTPVQEELHGIPSNESY